MERTDSGPKLEDKFVTGQLRFNVHVLHNTQNVLSSSCCVLNSTLAWWFACYKYIMSSLLFCSVQFDFIFLLHKLSWTWFLTREISTSTNDRHTHAQQQSSTNQAISARAYMYASRLCFYLCLSHQCEPDLNVQALPLSLVHTSEISTSTSTNARHTHAQNQSSTI